MTDIPTELPDDVAQTVRDAIDNLKELRIENRIYALNESDLPDDVTIHEEDYSKLPYYVDGQQPMFEEFAVALDDDGCWIAAQWASRYGHWDEGDFAGQAYDVMEQAGINRPVDNPNVGVQFGTGNSIAVENVIENATGGNE